MQHKCSNGHTEIKPLQNFKHIFCFTHFLQFKMSLFKCTEHSLLYKTQQSDIKSHVCHSKWHHRSSLATICVTWPNRCYCYHFSQEVSTNRPQVSTCFSNNSGRCCRERKRRKRKRKRRREGENERGGRVRGGAGRGAHGQRRTTFRWNQSDLSWWCHQPWADPDRLTERASSQGHILFLQFYFSVYGSVSAFLFALM